MPSSSHAKNLGGGGSGGKRNKNVKKRVLVENDVRLQEKLGIRVPILQLLQNIRAVLGVSELGELLNGSQSGAHKFLLDLDGCHTLVAQHKLLHTFKGKIHDDCTEMDWGLLYLVFLFLACSPESAVFRVSSTHLMEEILTEISLHNGASEAAEIAEKACKVSLLGFQDLLGNLLPRRDRNWLQLLNSLLNAPDVGRVVRSASLGVEWFSTCVSSLKVLIGQCVQAACGGNTSTNDLGGIMEFSSEATGCVSSLFSAWGPENGQDRNSSLLDLVELCCCALKSGAVYKDALISHALGAVHLSKAFWISQGVWDSGRGAAILLSYALQGILDMGSGPHDGVTVALSSVMSHARQYEADLSSLSLCRGVFSACDDVVLCNRIPSASGQSTSLYLGILPAVIVPKCLASDPYVRIAAIQVALTWMGRLINAMERKLLFKDAGDTDIRREVKDISSCVAGALLLNWESPTRRSLAMLPALLGHLLDLERCVVPALKESVGHDLLIQILAQPNHRKGKYTALSVLIDKEGAKNMFQHSPHLVANILGAIAHHRGVAKAASSCLVQLLKDPWKSQESGNAGDDPALCCWVREVTLFLASPDFRARQRIMEFCVRDAVKYGGLPALVSLRDALREELRKKHMADSQGREPPFLMRHERLLLSLVSLGSLGREVGLHVYSGMDGGRSECQGIWMLSSDELRFACTHQDPSLRIAAVSFIVGGGAKTSLPDLSELHILRETLFYSLKCPDAENNVIFTRVIKTFVEKLSECFRAAQRKQDLKLAESCKSHASWLCREVTNSLYPRTPFAREVLGLLLLRMLGDNFCWPSSEALESKDSFPLISVVREALCTPHVSFLLLGLMTSSWDSTRSLAQSILVRMPVSLPHDDIPTWGRWALRLLGAPRQTESDAGALALCTLFSIYCRQQGWIMSVVTQPNRGVLDLIVEKVEGPPPTEHGSGPPRDFLASVALALECRVNIMKSIVASSEQDNSGGGELGNNLNRFTYSHGLVCALKYLIRDLDLAHIARTACPAELASWRQIVWGVVNSIMGAFQLSLNVLSHAEDDEAPQSDEGYRSCGPMNSNTHLQLTPPSSQGKSPPTQIDCRGHMVLCDPEEDDLEGLSGKELQKVVMGSWLLIKECSSALGEVVSTVPLYAGLAGLLDTSQVEAAGTSALLALLSLRHMGAVAYVQIVLQNIASVCVRSSADSAAGLHCLPSVWIEKLLQRMKSENGQFVLRRSTGFGYAFQALLRSERRNACLVLFPRTVSQLLQHSSPDTATSWRSRIHALNVLRLLFGDTTMAGDILEYASEATKIALAGFDDSMWAIRNSSTMLYAAIIRRVCQDKVHGPTGNRGVNVQAFFSMHPDLLDFLLQHLGRATELSLEGSLHPMLQPILLLLSQLHSRADSDTPAAPTSTSRPDAAAAFIPVLLKASCARHWMARSMSARALVSLVSSDKRPGVLCTILASVPAETSHSVQFNAVHGALLQALHLFQACQGDDDSVINFSAEYEKVCSLILARGWLGTPQSCPCPPVRHVLLEILDVLTTLNVPLLADLQRMRSSCWSSNSIMSERSVSLYPGQPRLSQDAVAAVSSEITSLNVPQLLRNIVSQSADIRRGALLGAISGLEAMCESKGAAALAAFARGNLQSLALEVSRTVRWEDRFSPLFQLTLRLLCRVCELLLPSDVGPGSSLAASLSELQLVLTEYAMSSMNGRGRDPAHTFTCADAVELSGHCLRLDQRPHGEIPWSKVVVQASKPCYSPLVRRAAASSILASGAMDTAKRSSSEAAYLWLALLRLVQDDDDRVRAVARRAAFMCQNRTEEQMTGYVEGLTISSIFSSLEAIHSLGSAAEKARVIRELLEILHSSARGLSDAIAAVREEVHSTENTSAIFLMEDLNLHSDKVLISQHAARSLLRLGLPVLPVEAPETHCVEDPECLQMSLDLLIWMESLLHKMFEEDFAEMWPGGPSYQPDLFCGIHSTFLAAMAIKGSLTHTGPGTTSYAQLRCKLSCISASVQMIVESHQSLKVHPALSSSLYRLCLPEITAEEETLAVSLSSDGTFFLTHFAGFESLASSLSAGQLVALSAKERSAGGVMTGHLSHSAVHELLEEALGCLQRADDLYTDRRALSYASSCVGSLSIRIEKFLSSNVAGASADVISETITSSLLPRVNAALMASTGDEEYPLVLSSRDHLERARKVLEGGENYSSRVEEVRVDPVGDQLPTPAHHARRASSFVVDLRIVEPGDNGGWENAPSLSTLERGSQICLVDQFLCHPSSGSSCHAPLAGLSWQHLNDNADPMRSWALWECIRDRFSTREPGGVIASQKDPQQSDTLPPPSNLESHESCAPKFDFDVSSLGNLTQGKDAWACYAMGLALYAHEEYARAEGVLAMACKLKPQEPDFLLRHWLCLHALSGQMCPPGPLPPPDELLTCAALCKSQGHVEVDVCQHCHELLCEWGMQSGDLDMADRACQHLTEMHVAGALDDRPSSLGLQQLKLASQVQTGKDMAS